jgi:hypothetical protein
MNNTDIPRLRIIKRHLQQRVPNLGKKHWLGAENFHLFNFNFTFTLWSKNEQDSEYLSLAYTNQIEESQAQLGCHDLTYAQLLSLSTEPNECHHSDDHFYIVPRQLQLGDAQHNSRLKEAMSKMMIPLRALLEPLIPATISVSRQDMVEETDHRLSNMSVCVREWEDVKRYNISALDKTIGEDRYFSKASSRAVLSECLEIGIKSEPQLYPCSILRERLHYMLSRTVINTSTIVGAGNGLFASGDIGANQLIRTYGGEPVLINSYSCEKIPAARDSSVSVSDQTRYEIESPNWWNDSDT